MPGFDVTLGGMTGHFLKAAAVSTENVVEMMGLTQKQIQMTMFATGAENLGELRNGKFVSSSRVQL